MVGDISLTQTGLSFPLQDVYQIVTCRNNGLTKVEHHSGKDNQSKVDTKSWHKVNNSYDYVSYSRQKYKHNRATI